MSKYFKIDAQLFRVIYLCKNCCTRRKTSDHVAKTELLFNS